MKELNELESKLVECNRYGYCANELTGVAEAFRALKQRAEAAEAKLAELERQEPVAMRYRWAPPHMKMPDGSQFYGDWKLVGDAVTANPGKDYERVNLYARPAPAINLAELVNDAEFRASFERWMIDDMKCIVGSSDPYPAGIEARNWNAWKACRAAILRNIE